jgi:hypothetical protein
MEPVETLPEVERNETEDIFQHTISTKHFQIEDVNSDNACFFRALANSFCFRSFYMSANEICRYAKTQYGNHKKPSDLFGHAEWGYSGEEQEKLARRLQQHAYRWIKSNKNKVIEWGQTGFECSVSDLVQMTHEIDIEDYLFSYRVFAGDDLPEKMETIHDVIYGDRWGGFIEQVALSHVYRVPIVVLSAHRYDTKKNKIMNGTIYRNKAYRDVYFKLYQTSGMEYLSEEKPPIFLLWKKINRQPHYMSLYPHDSVEFERDLQALLQHQH